MNIRYEGMDVPIDHVIGTPSGGEPYYFRIPHGFNPPHICVYEHSEDTARAKAASSGWASAAIVEDYEDDVRDKAEGMIKSPGIDWDDLAEAKQEELLEEARDEMEGTGNYGTLSDGRKFWIDMIQRVIPEESAGD